MSENISRFAAHIQECIQRIINDIKLIDRWLNEMLYEVNKKKEEVGKE